MKLLSYNAALAIILAVCGGVIGMLLLAEAPHGRVAGRMVTADGGMALRHVPVTLVPMDEAQTRSYSTTTDARGNFAFLHVPVGLYRLHARTRAHEQPTQQVVVEEGETERQTFELKPQQPFLRIFDNQQVFTTHEAPKLRCHGFTPDSQFEVKIYRVATSVALNAWHGWLSSAMAIPGNNLREANLDALPQLTQLAGFTQQVKRRDDEGVFREEIHLGKQAPGMYLVALQATKARAVTVLTVTDLGLVVKASSSQVLAYALEIDTGKPVANAQVEVKQQDKLLAQGRTGSDGLLVLRLPAERANGEIGVLGHYGQSLALANFYEYEHETNKPLKVYTYTDRPVYRPGHTVHFKSMLRELSGEHYSVPSPREATVRVVDGSENAVFNGTFYTNRFGTLAGEFPLSENALPGTYALTINTGDGTYDASFSVAEYRKPEYEVNVEPMRSRCTNGEIIDAKIGATYYYGAPVPNAKVDYYVTRSQYYYYDAGAEWDNDPGGGEGDVDFDDGGGYGEGEIVTSGHGVTDSSGLLAVRIPTRTKEEKDESGDSAQDWRYTIHATVTDASKRGEEGSGSVMVTPGDFRLEATQDAWVAKPGQAVRVTVRALDYAGKPVPHARGQVEFTREEWRDNSVQHLELVSQGWQADGDGKAQVTVTPRKDGDYRILFTAADSRGNRMTHSTSLWTMSEDCASFDYPYQDLEVKADKALYKEGDTAQIMVNTRYAPQIALLTIEGTDIKEHRLVKLSGKSTIVNVKVRPDFMPAVRASVCFIKGKHLLSGEANIKVSRERKALRVQIVADKPSYQPGEKAVYQVKTTTPQGQPVPAEVSVGVVDESVYAVAADSTPEITAFFYPKRVDGVRTVFSFPEVYLSGDDKAGSKIRTRRDFPDTALWEPAVVTDENGSATVTLTMPDSLTTWRTTARAVDLETRVGQGTAKTIVSKPFLVRLEAPRFFTQGDQVEVAAVAHNLTDQPVDATVGLDAGALQVHGNVTATRRIAPGQTERIAWEVTAPSIGNLPVRVWGKAGALADAMELTLPVIPKGRPCSTAHSGVVLAQETIPEEIRADCVPGSQQLTVRLTPSLASAMLGSLDYLAQYPYGCAEQTMSSFLPDIVLMQLLEKTGIRNPGLKRQLPKMVQAGLLRLYGYQHSDGGWHWWEFDDTDPWMTAYVVYGLLQARDAGFSVTPRVLDQGIEALARLATDGTKKDPDTVAFMAYVLALAGRSDVAISLADSFLGPANSGKLAQLGDWGQGMLMLALDKLGRTSEARALLEPCWRHLANGQYAPQHGSRECEDAEHAAALLMAGSEVAPDDPRLAELVSWLFRQRQENHWTSTRDTAFVLYGLSRYLIVSHELQPNMDAVVTLDGNVMARKHFAAADIFQPEFTLTLDAAALDKAAHGRRFTLAIAKSGTGRLYYSTALSQVAAEDLTVPVYGDAGLRIDRSYRQLIAGERPKPHNAWERSQTSYHNGDIIEVTLTIHAARPYDYLMVEDMLPAGCEVRDRGTIDPWDWNYWWCEQIVRDQKVGFAIRHLNPGVQRITYRMTAQTPGRFTALPPIIYNMYDPTARGDGMAEVINIR